MAQTKDGVSKMRQTMIRKHGSEEAWKDFMRSIAAKGGSNNTLPKGFAVMDKAKVSAAGRKGGQISRPRRKEA